MGAERGKEGEERYTARKQKGKEVEEGVRAKSRQREGKERL